MQPTTILSEHYLDILFANRNRTYGAYELRVHYGNRALAAAASVLFVILCIVGLSFIPGPEVPAVPDTAAPAIATTVDLKRIRIKKPEHEVQTNATIHAVKKYTTFVVKKDEEVTDKVTAIKKLAGKQIGATDIEGEQTDSDEGSSARIKGEPIEKPEWVEPVAASPVRYSSVMPDFNGDLKTYLQRALTYPSFARENDVQGRVTVEFIVNEDGSITGARIVRGIGAGCDEEALRVVNAMPRWKPGMNNGKPVKVYMILPINFQLN